MSENAKMKNTTAGATPSPRQLTGVDMTTVRWIPMELLHRSPYQVRREGDVSELAADIQAHGLINPITVRRRSAGDGFEVVAGHRRWAAMRSVDPKAEVPCIVLDVDDRTAEELLVAENFVRADLSIMEQAETVELLTEHGRTAEECGKVCRRSVRWAHRMRAIGGIGEPWRGFFHVAGLPYACVLAVARLPEAVRADAWRAYWRDIATDLTEDEEAPEDLANDLCGQDLATIRGQLLPLAREEDERADDYAGELAAKLQTDAGLRAFLEESPDAGPRFALDDPTGPIGGALARFRALKEAPFDVAGCAGCARRSDTAPDLWGEDDGTAAPARCLDCECWAKRVAEHVRETLAAAAARGVTAAAEQSASYDWRDRDSLEEALKEADGDASRVTPVVKVFGGADDLQPTGRVLWRVAPPDAEDEPAETPAPPKREPWEEWTPANPRWMPTLFGDTRDRLWFAVGRAIGAAMSQPPNLAEIVDALSGGGEDYFHVLVRCEYWKRIPSNRVAPALDAMATALFPNDEKLVAARKVYAEACKHLPPDTGEAWEDGDNE